MIDFKDLDKFINVMIRNVSPHLKDDAYQAACIGILKALEKYDPSIAKFSTYINSHKFYVEDEILKLVAELSLPFSINKLMLVDVIKFKRGEMKNLSKYRESLLNRLANTKRMSYDTQTEA